MTVALRPALAREPSAELGALLTVLPALAATLVFAVRDNIVRWLAVDADASPELAAAVTMATGALTIATWAKLARAPFSLRPLRLFAPAGVLFGLSYVCLFEAYYRGRVTVVSPLVATESLWGVLFSAVFLHRVEVIGLRLALGAGLIVAGGVFIGLF